MKTMNELQKQRVAAATSAAVVGRLARSCEGCSRRRARWYCPADDAFLCQSCDSSIHQANPLARRHDRIRLQQSVNNLKRKLVEDSADDDQHLHPPLWLKRKARTPRPHTSKQMKASSLLQEVVVPETDGSVEDNGSPAEEQLIYRVPVHEPVLSAFYSPSPLSFCDSDQEESKPAPTKVDILTFTDNVFQEDVELAEFASDMELLLGRGAEDFSSMEALRWIDTSTVNDEQVKLELGSGTTKNGMEFNLFDSSVSMSSQSSTIGEESMVTTAQNELGQCYVNTEGLMMVRRVKLELDYESIITAWESHGSSPWTGGERPQLSLDNCYDNLMWMMGGTSTIDTGATANGEIEAEHTGMTNEGRQARVTRYREKRRTRLFSKKIRYEVRKLNAEKRPRMKGRFVKRVSFAAASGATVVSTGFSL